jgi:protocatechuate 3,4-dioxygenase beta subunit
MGTSSTNLGIVLFVLAVLAGSIAAVAQTGAARVAGTVLDPQGHPVATSDKAYPSQLSGTVVDTSGAVIAGATVQVRSANGTVQRTTQSDTNGSFIISGLAAG